MNFFTEILIIVFECFFLLIAGNFGYLITAIVVGIAFGFIGWMLAVYFLKLWNKRYFFRTVDYLFLTLFSVTFSALVVSLFSLKYVQSARLAVFNQLWYNELALDKTWQDQLLRLNKEGLTQGQQLLYFTKKSLIELEKRTPFIFNGLKKQPLKINDAEQLVRAINAQNQYYTIDSFQPRDGLKALQILLEKRWKVSPLNLLVIVLLQLVGFFLIGLICLSPVVVSAYKKLRVYV